MQYGFRRMRSYQDALLRFTSYIHEAFSKGEHIVCIMFDMEKAYDTTWRFGLQMRIHEVGLREPLTYFIKNFLTARRFRTRVGSAFSEFHPQVQGAPQGSVLSCCLFALAIDWIASCIPASIKSLLYVDDFIIYSSANYLPSLELRIQHAVNLVLSWTMNYGFTISQSKTVGIHFHRKRGHENMLENEHGKILFYNWNNLAHIDWACCKQYPIPTEEPTESPCFDYTELL